MYKNLMYLCLIMLMAGCDSASECFQASGEMVSKNIQTDVFSMINVGEGIELVLRQGDERSVVVYSGDNIIDEVSGWVANDELFLRSGNGCNWSRTYNNTTVVVTTPILTKVYSATQFAVRSEGILNFPTLTLQSAMFSKTASGTYDLNVNCEVLTIEDNASSFFKLQGTTIDVNVNFYDGNARFDGTNLGLQNAYFFQRSSNDIIISPQQSVAGKIYSTGNVVLKNVPAAVDVVEYYTGRLIYP